MKQGLVLFALLLTAGCSQYSTSSYETAATTTVAATTTITTVITATTSAPDTNSTITSSTATTTTTAAAISFTTDVQPIFNSNCISCHPASGGMNLTSGNSYSNLVNVTSQGYAPTLRVKPSDEVNSLLAKKIEGAAGFGDRMPQGGAALSAANIQKIKDWINQGAQNN